MPRKRSRKKKRLLKRTTLATRRQPHFVIAIVVLLSLTVAGTVMTFSGAVTPIKSKQKSKHDGTVSTASFDTPSKEYIYAGSRLVATEEPVSSSLSAPVNLRAITASGSTIQVTWNAVSGAVRYQLERSSNYLNGFSIVDANITASTFCNGSIPGVIAYCDTVTSGAAYIYRVLAFDQGGNGSQPSNLDVATATSFFEDPVSTGLTVKEAHVIELRQAVNYVRTAAGIGPFNGWTDTPPPALAHTVNVMRVHIEELRFRLGEAGSALSLPAPSYTDPVLVQGTTVKAAHIQQLRQLIKGYKTVTG